MREYIEVPDIIVDDQETGDSLEVFVDRRKVEFRVSIDNTGNIFKISKERLKELIR